MCPSLEACRAPTLSHHPLGDREGPQTCTHCSHTLPHEPSLQLPFLCLPSETSNAGTWGCIVQFSTPLQSSSQCVVCVPLAFVQCRSGPRWRARNPAPLPGEKAGDSEDLLLCDRGKCAAFSAPAPLTAARTPPGQSPRKAGTGRDEGGGWGRQLPRPGAGNQLGGKLFLVFLSVSFFMRRDGKRP